MYSKMQKIVLGRLALALALALAFAALFFSCDKRVNCPANTEKKTEYDFIFKRKEYCLDNLGFENGPFVFWHKNGRIKQSGTYLDGEIEGKWTSWYDNGQAEFQMTLKKGRENGKYSAWHPNGQLQIEGWYQNGEPVWSKPTNKSDSKPWEWCWNQEGKIVQCPWMIVEDFVLTGPKVRLINE